ncbi:hypothetical protein BsWGS_15274 [Bradybaena similaris]
MCSEDGSVNAYIDHQHKQAREGQTPHTLTRTRADPRLLSLSSPSFVAGFFPLRVHYEQLSSDLNQNQHRLFVTCITYV